MIFFYSESGCLDKRKKGKWLQFEWSVLVLWKKFILLKFTNFTLFYKEVALTNSTVKDKFSCIHHSVSDVIILVLLILRYRRVASLLSIIDYTSWELRFTGEIPITNKKSLAKNYTHFVVYYSTSCHPLRFRLWEICNDAFWRQAFRRRRVLWRSGRRLLTLSS